MIVYGIRPLNPENTDPPEALDTGMYKRLFTKPSRNLSLNKIDGVEEVTLPDGFTLRVHRDASDSDKLHPIDALLYELNAVRNSGEPDEMVIPGQAFGNSDVEVGCGPTEGVVLVLCGSNDWARPRVDYVGGLLDPVPALYHPTDRSTQVPHEEAKRGSYITADSRGLVIDYDLEFDHADYGDGDGDGELICDEEASPFLAEFAVQHAIRTYDITRAARSIDDLSDFSATAEKRAQALTDLRAVQLKMAARGVESLVENRDWQSFSGHDAFRMQQITRRESARVDRQLSEQFSAIQPVIEASEAELQRVEAAKRAGEREVEADRLRKADGREVAREARVKRVTGLAAAVVGGVALIGLFAALAAIPVAGGTFNPYVRAAFATLTLAALVAAFAWILQIAMRQSHVGHGRRVVLARILGAVFVSVGVVVSALGWLTVQDPSPTLLVLALVVVLVGVVCLTYAYEPDVESD